MSEKTRGALPWVLASPRRAQPMALTGRALATVCGGRLTHVDPRVRVVRARDAAPPAP